VTITEKIKHEFGSRKGFIRYLYFQLFLKLGFFDRYKKIDFSIVDRLVFVCTGNICRSPFAEAVARKNGVKCYSFGLDTRGGDKADPRAIEYAATQGFDLSSHVTRKLTDYKVESGDLLILMEPAHLRMLPSPLRSMPVTFAGLWLDSTVIYLHDPYNTCSEYFEKCESLVMNSTQNLLKKIVSNVRHSGED
jgi:protein-tyrosine phosphatase